jgi:hypothetical protein
LILLVHLDHPGGAVAAPLRHVINIVAACRGERGAPRQMVAGEVRDLLGIEEADVEVEE